MIIANGYIEIKRKTGGGIDTTTGYPIKPEAEWGGAIDCQYSATRYNNLAMSGGEPYRDAAYSILIEEQPLDGAEQLRLHDKDGNVVGEYSIVSIEPLDAVCEIRITCQ